MLVEEDIYSTYYELLLKYFVAEGIANKQSIYYYRSAMEDAQEFIQSLPYITATPQQKAQIKEKSNTGEDIKIAWQYKKYLQSDNDNLSSSTNKKSSWCHSFDMNKKMSASDIVNSDIHAKNIVHASNKTIQDHFTYIYEELNKVLLEDNQKMASGGARKVSRIAIQSVSDALWGSTVAEREAQTLQFLRSLKGLLRQSLASCVVTIPSHLFSEVFMQRVRHTVDGVVHFSSFSDSKTEKSPAFADFDGLFIVKKLSKVNTLVSLMSSQPTYTFQFKRKRLYIEKIHLPPEISRSTTSTPEGEKAKKSSTGSMLCQPGPGNSALDF